MKAARHGNGTQRAAATFTRPVGADDKDTSNHMRHLRIFLLAGAAIPFALAAQAPAQGAEISRYQTAQPVLMAEALPDEEREEQAEDESAEADEEATEYEEEAEDESDSEQEDTQPESETETEAEAQTEADTDAAPDRPDEQQSAEEIDENGQSDTREAGDRDERRDEPDEATQEQTEEQPAPASEDARPEEARDRPDEAEDRPDASEDARDGEREGLRERLRERDGAERRDRDRSQPSRQTGDDRPADNGDAQQPTSEEAEPREDEPREDESEQGLRQVPDEERSRDEERPAAQQERNGEREGLRERLRERRDRAEEGRRDRRDEAGERRDRDRARDERRDRREDARERDDRERDAREAQRELEEIAEEQEELREEVRELREQRESELRELQNEIREQRRGDVVERSGDRIIIRSDNRYHIQHNDNRRFVQRAENIETRRLDRGWTETIVYRPDGVQVVTVRDRYGDIVTRTRVLRDGREFMLIDNRRARERERPRRRVDYYSDVLPPIRIDIPREQYIVETRQASRRDIQRALTAPPVEQVQEAYSLEEVLYNERIRDMVPRVDLDTITFEFDSAEVPDDQIDTLEDIGYALEEIIYENPEEIYLVEGHTDAPGTNAYNLALSDRRAENVAMILTEFFDIPPENLVTQGYGEEYLKIDTQERERRNRRVTVRRITPLMAEVQ